MNQQSKIPSLEIRARHIAKLKELNRRMDKHILDLDDLNALLEANLREQRRRIEWWREEK
ncbi:hypothetical protein [Chroococcidiopsis sp. CCNUC1]|uniref:hypothetical protein n=1 Tax=Chroococcidiopsis sp. CCNUC1 TaxID=2653189 RepID=UPI000D06F098|nr:hypothetical protein [Chroococcidiopsis sp. CCNUC1]PSB47539.1 hypothetical protein C7B80_09280 [Cyanosarcina cf. burmensis CCALA 770]URD50872.1 hypothetical protein M5J74_02530 [Chroococcidiopsis sp. CCNUC1]